MADPDPPAPAESGPGEPAKGDVVGAGYRVEALLGKGGMGAVYRATEIHLDRPVALKVIKQEHAQRPEYREAFLRESRLAARILHPNVVPVFHGGEDPDGRLYLAMQYVGGAHLGTVIEMAGRLDPEEAVRYVTDVAAALDQIHATGLVHADVKPANVLVHEGHAVLTDFGIARESRAATDVLGLSADSTWLASARGEVIAGTSAYMAPEQWQRAPIDGRVDIYALGGLLHAMLTGRPPYLRGDPLSMRDAHLHAPPPSPTAIVPDLPPGFDAVVQTAMAKDPNHRYPTGAALASAAQAAIDHGGNPPAAGAGAPTPTMATRRGPGSPRRIAVRVTAVISVLTALVVGTTTATRSARDRDRSSGSQAGGPAESASGALSNPTEAAPLGVVFQDDFSGSTGNFEAADGADGSARRTDGRFRIMATSRNARFTSVSMSAPLRGNIRVDAEAVRLGEVPAGFGVSCRLNTTPGLSHYMAEIGRAGTWRILRYDGSERPGTSLKAHAAPDPPPPQNVPVRVGLECIGSDVPGTEVLLKLYVDGTLVGTVSDPQGLSVGSVGLTAIAYSGVPADVRFDNVVVTRS